MMTDDELLAFSSSLFEEDDDDDGFFGTQLSEFCESIESSDIDQFISSFEDKGQFDDLDLDLNFSLFDGFGSMLEADFSTPQERRRNSSNSTTIKVETKLDSSRSGNRKTKQETTMTTTTTTSKYVTSSNCNNSSGCNRIKKVKSKNNKKKKVAGISLLAKPPKVTKVKKSINENRICPSRFAAYFYRTHDYCSNPNKLYQDHISKNCSPKSSSSSSSCASSN
ncbi:uncharacterized protein LOC141855160 [Brevipalpus obovatus]|uniref:uncharacterized protein LOC141855160 n=1 Tax=Brevipalpus obovatus TaxID=246614 RepID=UPI003D9E19D5